MKYHFIKTILVYVLAFAMLLSFAGCSTQRNAEIIQSTTAVEDDPVIIRIDGQDDLTLSQLNAMVESSAAQAQAMYGIDLSAPENEQALAKIRDQCISAYLIKRVELHKVQELKLDQLSQLEIDMLGQRVQTQYEYYRQQFYDQLVEQGLDPEATIEQVMEDYGLNVASLSNDVQTQYYLEKLKSYVVEQSEFAVAEEDARAYYDQQLAQQKELITQTPELFVSYWNQGVLPLYRTENNNAYTWILIQIDNETLFELESQRYKNDAAYAENHKKALAQIETEAKSVAADIAADPTKYDAYFEKYGAGLYDASTLPQGIGYCLNESSAGTFAQEMVDAALSLTQDGQISPLVAGYDGYYILRRECAIAAGEMAYEEVADAMMEFVRQEKMDDIYQQQIIAWAEELEVEVLTENLK